MIHILVISNLVCLLHCKELSFYTLSIAHCLKVQTFITTFQQLFLLLSSRKYLGKHLLDLFSVTGQLMPNQLSQYTLHEEKK